MIKLIPILAIALTISSCNKHDCIECQDGIHCIDGSEEWSSLIEKLCDSAPDPTLTCKCITN